MRATSDRDVAAEEGCFLTNVGSETVAVRRTFLTVPSIEEEDLMSQRRRSSSVPALGSCDREAHMLNALTYKVPPVAGGADSGCAWVEEAPSESTAAPDADSVSEVASMSDQAVTPAHLGGATPAAPSSSVVLQLVKGECAPLAPQPELLVRSRTCPASVATSPFADPQDRHRLSFADDEPLDASLLQHVPVDEQGAYTSIGSVGHAEGVCKPCVFAHHAEKICANGVQCRFCHFEHEPKRRMRLRKQRRPGSLQASPTHSAPGGGSWWS